MAAQDRTNAPDAGEPQLAEEQMRGICLATVAAWNAHDVEAITAQMTDDIVWTQPGTHARGAAAAAEEVRQYFTAFPDLTFDLGAFEPFANVERQSMVMMWSASGTMDGPLQGAPATGRHGSVTGMTLFRFRGERVAEHHILFDGLDYLQQLGLLPATESAAFKAVVMGEVVVAKASGAIRSRLAIHR